MQTGTYSSAAGCARNRSQLGEKAVVVRDPLAVPVETFGMGHCTRDRYLGSVATRSGPAVKEFVSD